MSNGKGKQTMQATVNNTNLDRFGFNRFATAFMALGLVAGIAIGASGDALIDNLRDIATSQHAVVMPRAHTSVNQGDGLIAGYSAPPQALVSHVGVEQGDGIVGSNHFIAPPLTALASIGQGEGLVGGLGNTAVLTTPVKAYDNPGMGNGWITSGRPGLTVRAFPPDGQGEGWVGNGRR